MLNDWNENKNVMSTLNGSISEEKKEN